MSEVAIASPQPVQSAFTGPSPLLTRLIAAGLLAVLTALLFGSVRQESQTFDESAHLLGGFEYWKHADFGRNPEHPPLVKLIAALPLLPMHLHEPPVLPIPFFKAQDLLNAAQLLYSGNADAKAILLRGRLAVALFSLALGLLVFFAAREMFNPLAALIALGLYTFEPVMLANGALVTTDVPLACLFFASVYAFYRYLNRPSPARLALCAIAAALAVVTKHSGLLVLPVFVLLAIADRFIPPVTPRSETVRDLRPSAARLVLALVSITIVSYAIVWTIYGFRYSAHPGNLPMAPPLAAYAAGLTHPLQRALITFGARHHLLPEAYLYGWVDILLIPGARPTFLLGHIFGSGRWFFFPAAFLIKSTLTLLILLLLVPFARIHNRRRELLFLVLPAAFFMLVAIFSMLNMGVRYLIPMYPFCIVLASAAAASFFNRSLVSRVAIAALLLFTVLSSLHSYPDFLAYSNEIAGGPSHTYRLLTDANADWGQGLQWTHTYLDQHPTSNCWLAYTDPVVPTALYGVQCRPLLTGMAHIVQIPSAPVPSTISGTVLISASDLEGLLWGPDTLNPYKPFLDRKPDAIIGNIILVYNGTFDVPLLSAHSQAGAAISLLRRHQFPQALALAQSAVAQAPDSAEINYILGQTLLASGQIPQGQQAIATAVHLAETIQPDYQKLLLHQIQHPLVSP